MTQDCLKAIAGKRIERLEVGDQEGQLRFTVKDGAPVVWQTEGDCCSETWFADIIGTENLVGHEVLKAEEIEVPAVEDNRTRQEEDQFYGVRLVTEKGPCEIIYRNSSNGYYGGSIYLPDPPSSCDKWKEISADWSA